MSPRDKQRFRHYSRKGSGCREGDFSIEAWHRRESWSMDLLDEISRDPSRQWRGHISCDNYEDIKGIVEAYNMHLLSHHSTVVRELESPLPR